MVALAIALALHGLGPIPDGGSHHSVDKQVFTCASERAYAVVGSATCTPYVHE